METKEFYKSMFDLDMEIKTCETLGGIPDDMLAGFGDDELVLHTDNFKLNYAFAAKDVFLYLATILKRHQKTVYELFDKYEQLKNE